MVLREGQDGVVAAERHAAVLGITGVPAFIFDRQYSVSGAQEVETFVQASSIKSWSSLPAGKSPRDAGGAHRPRARPHRGTQCSPGRPCARRRAPRRHPERCPSRDARARDHAVLSAARGGRRGRLRLGAAKQLPRLRPPAADLECEVQRRGDGERCGRTTARCALTAAAGAHSRDPALVRAAGCEPPSLGNRLRPHRSRGGDPGIPGALDRRGVRTVRAVCPAGCMARDQCRALRLLSSISRCVVRSRARAMALQFRTGGRARASRVDAGIAAGCAARGAARGQGHVLERLEELHDRYVASIDWP